MGAACGGRGPAGRRKQSVRVYVRGHGADIAHNRGPRACRARLMSAADFSAHTPMMAQYPRLKADFPDTLLFYRMGISTRCSTPTPRRAAACWTSRSPRRAVGRRADSDGGRALHSVDLPGRLIKLGESVAICEQVGDVATARGRSSAGWCRRGHARHADRCRAAGRQGESLLLAVQPGALRVGLAWLAVTQGRCTWPNAAPTSWRAGSTALHQVSCCCRRMRRRRWKSGADQGTGAAPHPPPAFQFDAPLGRRNAGAAAGRQPGRLERRGLPPPTPPPPPRCWPNAEHAGPRR